MRGVGVTSGESGGHVLAGCACPFRPPGASAAADSAVPRRTRTAVPRERLRFFSNPTMPPERRSRTKPEQRTGSRPNRKIRMKPDRKAGAGPGGPPRKAAYSSQRKPPAGPRAAAAALTIAAAEESRLRELNRQTLEEDKPAVERCLEELVFGDVADNEDALLRRLRGPRVREAAARGLGALGRGARWAANLRRRSLGDLRRRGDPGGRERENAGAEGGLAEGLGRAETAPSPRAWKLQRLVPSRRSTPICLADCGQQHLSWFRPAYPHPQCSSLGVVRSPVSVPCGDSGVPLGLWN